MYANRLGFFFTGAVVARERLFPGLHASGEGTSAGGLGEIDGNIDIAGEKTSTTQHLTSSGQ